MADLESLVRERILSQPFGSLTKGELEYQLFASLLDAGMLGESRRINDVSRTLRITTAKARNLLYQYDLRRSVAVDTDESLLLAEAITVVDYSPDDDPDRRQLTLGVESRYLREQLVDRLKLAGVWSDTRLNGELVVVKLNRFVEAMPTIFADGPYDEIIAKLQDEAARKRGTLDKTVATFVGQAPAAAASSTVAALFAATRTALGL
jgi:hypothetical protein